MIATDIDALHKTVHPSTSLRDVLEDEAFCGGTGARHAPPYGWLETVCEEMIEDKIGQCMYVPLPLLLLLLCASRAYHQYFPCV